MTKHNLVGTSEYIRLPEISKADFAAKIDTGADSSSMWASDIEQNDNILSYKFFAQGSAYYTGQEYKTDRFKITSVKNSFGHEEVRYKIRLKVKMGKSTYTSWFTLADRSRNSFPILIGKNFLKNRFVVDVSKNYLLGATTDPKKVLVITVKPTEMAEFLDDAKQHNKQAVQYKTVKFEKLLYEVNENETKIINTADSDRDVADYSMIYVKSHWGYPEFAATLADYLIYRSKPFFDKELRNFTSRGKLSESMKLATHGIPVPHLFAGLPKLLEKQADKIVDEIGFPFVFKAASADRGKENYFVSDIETFDLLLEKVDKTEIYLVQKFIPNDGFYRLNVFGHDAKLAIFRAQHPNNNPLKKHLNKPFGGVNTEKIPMKSLPPELTQLAVRASIYMKRDIAGVDIIQDKTNGKCYILEVNSSPQLRTGSFIDEKATEFAKFIDKELKR